MRRACVAVVLTLLTASCGGDSAGGFFATTTAPTLGVESTTTGASPATTQAAPTTPEPTTAPADGGDLRLVAPPGWVSSVDGLVIAETDAGLVDVEGPAARIIDVTDDDTHGELAGIEVGTGDLTRPPELVTVAGFEALATTFTDSTPSGVAQSTTLLIVDTGGGAAQVFLLQGPSERYPELEAAMLAAIQVTR
jgi:hypothetical protein